MYNVIYFDNNNNGDYMNLEKIMSKDLIVGNENNTLVEIATLMKKYDVGFIPIAKENKIIGVITDRDIVVNAISNNDFNSEISNYITKNLITLDQNETIETALILMGQEKIKRLLITHDDYLVGIISISDIITNKIDSSLIINNLQKIWQITHNNDRISPKVNEFKL